MNTELFEQAWAAVCTNPLNWWWSEQLCLFTVGAWTVFLAIEGNPVSAHFWFYAESSLLGQRHNVKHVWAYMLLGQLVAISVASNLFYCAVLGSEARKNKEKLRHSTKASIMLSACTIVSLLTVWNSPRTSQETFLPNLLTMHVLIVLPLLPWFTSLQSSAMSLETIYAIVAAISFALRIRTTHSAFYSLPQSSQNIPGFLTELWTVLHSHPAQSSIGWDVIWTSISFLVWSLQSPSFQTSPVFAGTLTAMLSAGVSAPYAFALDALGSSTLSKTPSQSQIRIGSEVGDQEPSN